MTDQEKFKVYAECVMRVYDRLPQDIRAALQQDKWHPATAYVQQLAAEDFNRRMLTCQHL